MKALISILILLAIIPLEARRRSSFGSKLLWGSIGAGAMYLYMKDKNGNEVKQSLSESDLQLRLNFCAGLKDEKEKVKCYENIRPN